MSTPSSNKKPLIVGVPPPSLRRAHNRPPRSPRRTAFIRLRVTEGFRELLERVAATESRTISGVLRWLVIEHAKRRGLVR